jgi:hypothetical protein
MSSKLPYTVKPWDKEIQNIFERLTRDRVAYTKNTRLASEFGSKYPELVDNDFIDVVTTKYRKKEQKTIFAIAPNVVIIPKDKRFSFHKIF